uniref:Uncharacterized protein n=1 Tax=Rhinolophus ferrumequinum TaxID=59479 RepID=A0A671G9M5_RHIFE
MNPWQSMELVDTARELSDLPGFSVMFPLPVANEKGGPISLAHTHNNFSSSPIIAMSSSQVLAGMSQWP